MQADQKNFRYDMDEKEFRAACAQRCAAHPDLPVLRTIAAVGAYHADFNGADVDSDRLTKGLIYMAQSGILIAPDFEVDTVNFLYERNFLEEKKQADMLFVSYVLGLQLYGRAMLGHHYQSDKMSYIREQMKVAADPEALRYNSVNVLMATNNSPENWCGRAVRGGVKMIYTHGGLQREISTGTFSKHYTALIPSPDLDKQDGAGQKDTRGVAAVHGQSLDIPLAWSGFCADKAYLEAIKPALNEANTDLAGRARDVLTPKTSFPVDRTPAFSL